MNRWMIFWGAPSLSVTSVAQGQQMPPQYQQVLARWPRRRRHSPSHAGMQPTIYSLHYWGTAPADRLAAGFKAALDQLGTPKTSAKH
jgi:hypothetical protein